MDKTLFRMLGIHLRSAAPSVGVPPLNVMIENGVIRLAGTGISVTWMAEAMGEGQPGWIVQERYHAINLLDSTDSFKERELGSFNEDDVHGAARATLLGAAERALEQALDEAQARL